MECLHLGTPSFKKWNGPNKDLIYGRDSAWFCLVGVRKNNGDGYWSSKSSLDWAWRFFSIMIPSANTKHLGQLLSSWRMRPFVEVKRLNLFGWDLNSPKVVMRWWWVRFILPNLKIGYFKRYSWMNIRKKELHKDLSLAMYTFTKPPTTKNLSSYTLLSISPLWFSGRWASCPPKIEGITMILLAGKNITNKYVHKQLPTCPQPQFPLTQAISQHPKTRYPSSQTAPFPFLAIHPRDVMIRTVFSAQLFQIRPKHSIPRPCRLWGKAQEELPTTC